MFLLLLSVVLQSAMAEPMECSAPYVLFSTPSIGQMNVPVDAQPAVYMSDDDCAAPSYYELVLSVDDMIVKSAQLPWESWGDRFLALDLEDELEPGTSYTLSIIAGDGWGEVTEISFRTGESVAMGLEGVPSIDVERATYSETQEMDSLEVSGDISPVSDADEMSIVFVYDELEPDRVISAHRVEDEASFPFVVRRAETVQEAVCLFAVQRDGAGRLSEPSAVDCEVFERSTEYPHPSTYECGVVSVGGIAWFMPMLALAAIRRRRDVSRPSDG